MQRRKETQEERDDLCASAFSMVIICLTGTLRVNKYAFARDLRDIHVTTQHGFINASKLESVGQVMLGLEPEWPFFHF